MKLPEKDTRAGAERRRKHFERRRRAAVEGLHLPDSEELLIGMPFLAADIQQDIRTFAERLLPRVRNKAADMRMAQLVHALEQATVEPGTEQVRDMVMAFEEAEELLRRDGVIGYLLRCRIYLACLGDPDAAAALAVDCIGTVLAKDPAPREAAELIHSGLEWLCRAGGDQHFDRYLGKGYGLRRYGPFDQGPWSRVEGLFDTLREAFAEEVSDPKAEEASEDVPSATTDDRPGKADDGSALSAVVFREVGNAGTGEGRSVDRTFRDLVDKPLPLVPLPDLARTREELGAEFPYAADILDRMLNDLVAMPRVLLQPTILVGSPGSGKTRFARALMTALGLSHEVFSCGGVADSSIGGTARRWSTGEPSLPVGLILRFKTASPGVVLDEIEKTGTSRHNGNPIDVLLSFFEAETSRRYFDPYVQAACDLSHVSWLATANTITELPRPFRDRCRILAFPDPGPEHVGLLANRILRDVEAEQGLDARWHRPLDVEEIGAIAEAWPGGSLRRLRRLVEGVMAVRRAPQGIN